jgi:hypothetical protein
MDPTQNQFTNKPQYFKDNENLKDKKNELIKTNVQNQEKMSFEDSLKIYPSRAIVSTNQAGVIIKGGDTFSLLTGDGDYKNGFNYVANSLDERNEAEPGIDKNNIKIKRTGNGNLTIEDDKKDHPNKHYAETDKNNQLNIKLGYSDGDEYTIDSKGGSVIKIEGQKEQKPKLTGDENKDTVSINVENIANDETIQINLKDFSSRDTNLLINGANIFNSDYGRFQGKIELFKKPDNPKIRSRLILENQ